MTTKISTTSLNSDDTLSELIIQSLDRILGSGHHIISRDLPLDSGHAILALADKPVLIVFDRHDGGQALLTGLKILEAFDNHRAWAFRLYPELLGNNQQAWQPEDIRLYILAPTPPPGQEYLERGLPQIRILTFQALLIDGDISLLIEPSAVTNPASIQEHKISRSNTFRTGMPELEKSEEDYFRNLNIMA